MILPRWEQASYWALRPGSPALVPPQQLHQEQLYKLYSLYRHMRYVYTAIDTSPQHPQCPQMEVNIKLQWYELSCSILILCVRLCCQKMPNPVWRHLGARWAIPCPHRRKFPLLVWFYYIFKGWMGCGGEVPTRAGQSIVLVYVLRHVLQLSRDKCVLALLMPIRCVTLDTTDVSGLTCNEWRWLLFCGQLRQHRSPVPKTGEVGGVLSLSSHLSPSFGLLAAGSSSWHLLDPSMLCFGFVFF